MSRFWILAIGLAGLGQSAVAQATTEAQVVGPSGVSVYSLRVIGANGIEYNCRSETEVREDETVRYCQPAETGTVIDGDPFGGLPAGGLLAALLIAIAVSSTSGTD